MGKKIIEGSWAAELIRTLKTRDCLTKLAHAPKERGRLINTLYLLRFVDDEAYWRSILVQLNRSVGCNEPQ